MSIHSVRGRVTRAMQRKPDRLDRAAFVMFLALVCVVGPMIVGARVTPYLNGKPAPLNALIRAEQVYIEKSRAALATLQRSHDALAGVQPAQRSAAFQGAARMQAHVETLDALTAEWQRITPPGRFAGLHRRMGETLAVYQQLATEAWAYYGDLNEAHIEKIRQALPAAQETRNDIAALLREMDFEAAPSLLAEPTPVPTPTVEGGYKFGQ